MVLWWQQRVLSDIDEEPIHSSDESVNFSQNDTLSGKDACFLVQGLMMDGFAVLCQRGMVLAHTH
jgi:hypothetical protein